MLANLNKLTDLYRILCRYGEAEPPFERALQQQRDPAAALRATWRAYIANADPPDLVDAEGDRRRRVEGAIDAVRAKLGRDAIVKGRSLGAKRRNRA